MWTAITLLATLAADPAATLTEGTVVIVADGFEFTEGPVWMPTLDTVLFSDIPANRIYQLDDKGVFRQPSGQSNGLLLDTEGRLLAAEHKGRRVSRTRADGTIEAVAAAYEGKRFNSPNDLIVRSDGVIFFTDPPYGLEGGLEGPNAELDFSGVYAILADGTVKLLVKDFSKPNGIALSPDEKTLYVADTEARHIRAFDLTKDASISNGRVLCDIMSPDGMAMDADGNLWATGGKAVNVISPSGELLQEITVPEAPANCTFGGPARKTLFITARTGVYKIRTKVPGLAPPYMQ